MYQWMWGSEALQYWAVAVVVVAVLMTSHTDAAPVATSSEPWETPCSSDAAEASGGFSLADLLPPSSLSELLQETTIAANKTKRLALALKQKYFAVKLGGNLAVAQTLDSQVLTGFPQPSQVAVWKGENDTVSVVKNDHYLLTVTAVFLQQVQDDEILSQSSLLPELNKYVTSLMTLICKLSSTLESLSVPADKSVTRDVMPASLREMTSTHLRNERDYIIVKDGVHLLTAMTINYVAMETHYKSTA